MPKLYGKKARMTFNFDTDHVHDTITCQLVTVILLFINNTPVRWHSKKQKTVKTSMYESELVAVLIEIDMIIEMRYIFCMLGAPIGL